MILVFIFLAILIVFLLLIFLILASTLEINIINFKLTNMKYIESPEYKIKISFNLFNKIKWFFINLNNKKIKNIYNKIKFKKPNFKKLSNKYKLKDIKIFKNIKFKISKLNLDFQLGFNNSITTAYIVAIIGSFISIILPYVIENSNIKNYKYSIVPIYENQNLYNIKLSCIIKVKMVHIINVIYIFIKKKGRSDSNERTTSHRRTYDYRYE